MTMPEVRPLRIFSVRWPLWQVEAQARFRESQPFDVVDHFLLRGVVEGRLATEADLMRFFGLSASLVTRGVDHLVHIGHLTRTGPAEVAASSLGVLSVQDGMRYVEKESRHLLYFDAFTNEPLPRSHYHGSVRILLDGEETAGEHERARWFRRLTSMRPFSLDAVRALGRRPDRARFNVPHLLEDLSPIATAGAWLPAHLLLTEDGVLAFTQAAPVRDTFLEQLCRRAPQVLDTLRHERGGDEPRLRWLDWLRERGLGRANLHTLPSGVWRATLPPQAFDGQLQLHRLGSFQVREGHFLQLWCDDERLRTRAVRQRALAICRRPGISRTEADDAVAAVAQLLDVPVPSFDELLRLAVESGDLLQRNALEALR
ncbi:hypothetical protein [Frankia sp. QA3]|uniref:hypothetical protein n=1 Tax=Frankia sp. QA3 TaxID=710111 RepID=UPI001E570CC7|nr:hypothetical protein [Frankia sp. QA3]